MTPEDVKRARVEYVENTDWEIVSDKPRYLTNSISEDTHDAILKSLAIVEKLLGEPSDLMYLDGVAKYGDETQLPAPFSEVFKAMRDKLIEEVEKDMEG